VIAVSLVITGQILAVDGGFWPVASINRLEGLDIERWQ